MHTTWTFPAPSRLHSQPCGFCHPFHWRSHCSLEQLPHPAPPAAWLVRCFPGIRKMYFESYWSGLGAEPLQKLPAELIQEKKHHHSFSKELGLCQFYVENSTNLRTRWDPLAARWVDTGLWTSYRYRLERSMMICTVPRAAFLTCAIAPEAMPKSTTAAAV